MSYPKVYADFHNADEKGRLRLNCVGTIADLSRLHIELRDGQPLRLYSEDLEVDGVVQYSDKEHLWVALIDWDAVSEIEEVAVSVIDRGSILACRVAREHCETPRSP